MSVGPTSTTRSRPRLQVSLQAMLLLTATVGVTITVYRWPWVAEQSFAMGVLGTTPTEFRRATTVRRDWRGRLMKHGVERVWQHSKLLHEAHFYEGSLHGPRRFFDANGGVIMEANYHEGTLHGEFRATDANGWSWAGRYEQGKQQGPWRVVMNRRSWPTKRPPQLDTYFFLDGTPRHKFTTITLGSDLIVMRQSWQQGKKQGTWRWETLQGAVLNTAEYENDDLELWNGRPIVEEFWQWVRGPEVNDPKLAALLGSIKLEELSPSWIAYQDTYYFTSYLEQQQDFLQFVVHSTGRTDGLEFALGPDESRTFVAGLCAMAAYDGYRFEYRDGVLCLLVADDPEPPMLTRSNGE